MAVKSPPTVDPVFVDGTYLQIPTSADIAGRWLRY